MAAPGVPAGELQAPPDMQERLRDRDLKTVADLLGRATCVRDLPARSNHRLDLAAGALYLKCEKTRRRGRPREVEGLWLAEIAGVPVPPLVCFGVDPVRGAVTATLDLAPARPLDAWLRDDAPDAAARHRVAERLAAVVAALHDGNRHHRDLYLNHVFVDPARADPVVAVIDWDRSGWHHRPFGHRVLKDLAALAASTPDESVGPGERRRFLARYLRARGRWSRSRQRRLGRRVEGKVRRIRGHVPRTPVGEAARP